MDGDMSGAAPLVRGADRISRAVPKSGGKQQRNRQFQSQLDQETEMKKEKARPPEPEKNRRKPPAGDGEKRHPPRPARRGEIIDYKA